MRGAGKPIWDDIATADDLAALSPPRPARMPERPDVLVVGGGVIGLSIAVSCTALGMDVLLVERESRLAVGPSGRAAGGLAPDAHPEYGPRWQQLARRSLWLHRAYDERWDNGLRTCDLLVLPDLVIRDQGHIDPLRFCAALARRAGTVVTGADHASLVDVRASHTVFATGDAPEAAGLLERSFVKGHLIATEPCGRVLDGIVASVADDVLALQLPSGHVVCGGTKEPGVERGDVDDEVGSRIVDALGRICGRELSVTHRWTCFRPLHTGERPFVSRIEERVWCASGFYSTGILMAPVVGELIAGAIANDESLTGLFD